MTAASDPAPPQLVSTSYWLYLAGAAVGLVGAVVIAIRIPASMVSARAQAADALAGQPTSTLSADQVVGIALGVSIASIVLSVVYSALMAVLAPRMRRGGNRARIALAAIAAVQVVGLLGSYGVGAVHFLIGLAAAVLSFMPSSNAWFRAARAAKPLA